MGYAGSPSWGFVLPLALVLVVYSATPALAFGAGNIPSYAYLEGKAFRHGDIEDVIEEISRSSGGVSGVLGAMTGGLLASKFKGLDIKRIYFGNWLRDYSQAMDVAGLSKLSKQAIINLVMVLGFTAHGYVTGEFEVTEERLGVYLPTEHIDNPKDYNDNKDARQVHPKLRPPVDPAELEVDHQTGMLNYIANEHGHWDTSKALVRRVLLQCIDMGRRARGGAGSDAQYEAFRLLGTALHTLEDFSAHSNYCELALLKLGHQQVFCHVGSSVLVRAPDGHSVPPLVTGTFGGSDFLHSLLSEGSDHISSAAPSDIMKEVQKAKSQPTDRGMDSLRDLLFQLPDGQGQSFSRDMDNIEGMRASGKRPEDMSPQELHAVLWQILSFRDKVAKAIANTIERIPGLGALIEKIGASVVSFIYVTIEPYLKPILQQATGALQSSSAAVVDSQDQYRVFNDPGFAHPTHSLLSKDHFSMILNEPAGNIAKIIVKHVVKNVVAAWDNTNMNANQVVEECLTCLHHPYFSNGSQLQREMMEHMQSWINGEDRNYVLNSLTKESVRNGKNHRKGTASDKPTQGPGGYTSFLPTPASIQHQATGYVHQQAQKIPGYQQYHQVFPGRDMPGSDGSGYPGQAQAYSQGPSYQSQDPYAVHQPAAALYSQPPPPGPGYNEPYGGQPAYGHQQPPGHHGGHDGGYGGQQPYGGHHGGPPPAFGQDQGGYGGPPGGYAQQEGGYPGANYQQHQQNRYQPPQQYGQGYENSQQGYSGNQWSGNAPPPGRW